jgi:GT2 family glycosyltransferase
MTRDHDYELWQATDTHPGRICREVHMVLNASNVPVILLNWNGWEDTFTCLDSIALIREKVEVWLVDNGSNIDRTDEAVAAYPGLRVLKWNENLGWAGGYNRALRLASQEGYEFAYLLNNDSTVTTGFLSEAVDVCRADPAIAAVGSCIAWMDSPGYIMFDGEFHDAAENRLVTHRSTRSVASVSGAAMLVRLNALEKDGYFDERFFCYFEETEWCLRMRKHGWSIFVAGNSLTKHRGLRSDVDTNREYYFHRNPFIIAEHPEYRQIHGGRVKHVYFTLRSANEARRTAKPEVANALASAVYDGLLKRFGRRNSPPPLVGMCLGKAERWVKE